MACGDMQSTAATPASAGAAAAVVSRREIWVRFDLLWQPKGLLSEQGALPWKSRATGPRPSGAPDSRAAYVQQATRGRLGKAGHGVIRRGNSRCVDEIG